MAKYRVEFSGSLEVEADSALEAECNASFDCRPDHCRAECIEGCDDEFLDEEDEE